MMFSFANCCAFQIACFCRIFLHNNRSRQIIAGSWQFSTLFLQFPSAPGPPIYYMYNCRLAFKKLKNLIFYRSVDLQFIFSYSDGPVWKLCNRVRAVKLFVALQCDCFLVLFCAKMPALSKCEHMRGLIIWSLDLLVATTSCCNDN
jgi:hypothetical protein